MYKVFNNDALIILNSHNNENSNSLSEKKVLFKEELTEFINQYFNKKEINDVFIFGYEIENLFKDFVSLFDYIEAAGGFVLNSNNDLLMIKRLGVWDLPKGKVEIGESIENAAIREVEEETSVKGLQIVNELTSTYHIYSHKTKLILKKTHWFKMKSNFINELIPQTQEDIEIAEWVDASLVEQLMNQSYRSIKEAYYDSFLY